MWAMRRFIRVIVLGGWVSNWFRSRYMLLRLSVKINVLVVRSLVCSTASNNAYSSTQRMFGYLGTLAAMWMFSGPLKTSKSRMLP